MFARSTRRLHVSVAAAPLALASWSMAQVPSFHLVGPEGVRSTIRGVSGDGSTAVGWAWVDNPDGTQTAAPFRWTFDGGFQPMPGDSAPRAVSYDGSVIVGDSKPMGGFRWTADQGYVELLNARWVRDVSADGSIAVGQANLGGVLRAVTWGADGQPTYLPGDTGFARCVSDDGLVVAGHAHPSTIPSPEASRWTTQTGLSFLGTLPGYTTYSGAAQACSADGNIVFGDGDSSLGSWSAFRWTPESGMVELGFLGIPQDVTPDGRVLVGYLFNGTVTPFVWNEQSGARNPHTILTDLGVDLGGWQLANVWACSDDGTIIVGDARRAGQPERAFVAVIPHTCPCELDGDTLQVDIFDLLAFLDRWFDGAADLDGNGATDVFDLLDFLTCWFPASAGAPCT